MKAAAPFVLVSALLFSWAAAAQYATPNCTKGSCEATVIIPAGCGSGIKVAPDPITVDKDDIDMTWVIRSKGWLFENNGIEVQGPKGPAFKGSGGGSPKYTVPNKNAKGAQNGTYKYDINIYRMVGDKKETCKLDPIIVNW